MKHIYINFVFLFYSLISIAMKLGSNQKFPSFNFFIYYFIVILMLFIYAIMWQRILKQFDLPLFKYLQEVKQYDKLISTYIKAVIEKAKEYDGRIHCSFQTLGADTGRTSCRNPRVLGLHIVRYVEEQCELMETLAS